VVVLSQRQRGFESREEKADLKPHLLRGTRTGGRSRCTGFCTDCLHPVLTVRYWPLGGGAMEVLEAKGRRLRISNL
jgi:hypothetical protein